MPIFNAGHTWVGYSAWLIDRAPGIGYQARLGYLVGMETAVVA